MKKVLALILVALLALSMTAALAVQTVGTASGTTGSVTITNATIGETYQGYEIFKATVARSDNGTSDNFADDTSTGITYTWNGNGTMPTNDYFTADPVTGYITATTAAGTTSLSDGAIALIKGWIGTDNSTYSFPATSATKATDTTLTFAGLNYGYWYFTSTLGTVVTINSTNPNVNVTDKNEKTTIEKEVKEDSNGEWQKQNDADVGQQVEFKVTVHAKKGAVGLVLYDKMSAGLTFDGISTIHVYDGEINAAKEIAKSTESTKTWTVTEGGDYKKGGSTAGNTVTTESGAAEFVLTFDDSYTGALTADKDFIVTYTATVNNAAVVATPETNDVTLKYGDENYTVEKETKTYVWGVKVVKYTGNDVATGTKLPDAKFVIYKLDTNNKAIYAQFDTNGKLSGWTEADNTAVADLPKQAPSHFSDTTTVLTSNSTGEINVSGLDEGSYYLLEIEAPDGYTKLDAARSFTIDSTSDTTTAKTLENNLTVTGATNGVIEIDVQNQSGSVLPSTGGIGTTIFYVGGGLLVLLAVILLVTKRRMKAED